jgi:sulfoxide reductase catalytic subunit YedY
MAAAGAGVAAAALGPRSAASAVRRRAQEAQVGEVSFGEELRGELNDYELITTYNNYYEFGTRKQDPAENAGDFQPEPWSVEVGGEVHKPGRYSVEDLVRPDEVEDRIYRLRCVEAWSMVVPWRGAAFRNLLTRVEPTSNAKFVAFETVYRPEEMPGQRRRVLEWPYVEGLRIDEAANELTFLATGLYGQDLPNQNGAPLRLVVPWKYGFKSIKSIVKITFTEEMPPTSWNISIPHEYGFYANVNPEVDHPRWSQARETRLPGLRKSPTLMFNGYAEQVEHMYRGMDLTRWY